MPSGTPAKQEKFKVSKKKTIDTDESSRYNNNERVYMTAKGNPRLLAMELLEYGCYKN